MAPRTRPPLKGPYCSRRQGFVGSKEALCAPCPRPNIQNIVIYIATLTIGTSNRKGSTRRLETPLHQLGRHDQQHSASKWPHRKWHHWEMPCQHSSFPKLNQTRCNNDFPHYLNIKPTPDQLNIRCRCGHNIRNSNGIQYAGKGTHTHKFKDWSGQIIPIFYFNWLPKPRNWQRLSISLFWAFEGFSHILGLEGQLWRHDLFGGASCCFALSCIAYVSCWRFVAVTPKTLRSKLRRAFHEGL